MTEPMSPEAYAKAGGNCCPVCGNTLLRCEMDWDNTGWTYAVQDFDCDECEASWKTIYTVTGYEDLTVPVPQQEV